VKRQFVIGGLILLGAILIAALMIMSRSEPPEKPKEELVPLVQAEPLEIRSGNLLVGGAGTVRAREELTLAAEVAGKLVYVNPNLREGQRIARGATLFRIDTSDFRNAVDTAQADVASQNVAVLQAREEVASAKAELERFERRSAESNAYASVDASDYAARLLPPDALTQDKVTKPEQVADGVPANNLATREPQLKSAQAALARAQAQLANARTSLGRTVVRAPFSGVVRAEQISVGSFVQPGQSLGSIVGTADFEAVIPLSPKEAALIPGLFGNGGRIQASVFSDYGGIRYRWQAYVDRVSSVLNPKTRTIDVYLRIPNPTRGGALAAVSANEGKSASSSAPPLFVGSFVSAEITGMALDEYAVLPLAALRSGGKVWLVRDGKLKIAAVEVFQRTDTSALISTAGLGQNPVVVTGGLQVATDGQKLRVASPNGTSTNAKPAKEKAGSDK
jgi:multidrug efflux pump subunit AcrA (membrane-fusion protein)